MEHLQRISIMEFLWGSFCSIEIVSFIDEQDSWDLYKDVSQRRWSCITSLLNITLVTCNYYGVTILLFVLYLGFIDAGITML